METRANVADQLRDRLRPHTTSEFFVSAARHLKFATFLVRLECENQTIPVE